MNKLLKTILVFALAAVLIVAGAFAASNLTLSATSTITFTGSGAPIRIQGEVTTPGVASGAPTYDQANYAIVDGVKKPLAEVPAWNLGTITLNSGDFVFAFKLTFINDGSKSVNVSVTRPVSLHANLRLSFSGENITQQDGSDNATLGTSESNKSVTYKYMLVLTNYGQTITANDFKFEVTFT